MESEKKFFTNIVQAWDIRMEPEFRGFRCGLCQKEITEARHHVLDSKKYQTVVHICEDCEVSSGMLKGERKPFWCDKCRKDIMEAWHIWKKQGSKLVETHLCKACGKDMYD